MKNNNPFTWNVTDLQSKIDKIVDGQSEKMPDFSRRFGWVFGFLYYSHTQLFARFGWVNTLIDKGPLLLSLLPSFNFPAAAAESTLPEPTESPVVSSQPVCSKKEPFSGSRLPLCDIGMFSTPGSDSYPEIGRMKKITKLMLRKDLSLMGIDAVDTIIDQFIDPDFVIDESETQTVHYSDLSTTEKTKLHKKILNSILQPSYTIDEKTGKPGGIKNDPLLQSNKAAANFKKAYYDIVAMAENGEELTLTKLNKLHRNLLPEVNKNHSDVRTDQLYKVGFGVYYMDHSDLKPLMRNLLTFIHTPIPGMNFNVREAILSGVFLTAHPYIDGNGRTSMLLAAYHAIIHDFLPSIYDFQGRPGLGLHGVFTSIAKPMADYLNSHIKTAKSKSGSVEIKEPMFFSRGVFSQLNEEAPDRLSWRLDSRSRDFYELQDWTKKEIIFNIKHNQNVTLNAVKTPGLKQK